MGVFIFYLALFVNHPKLTKQTPLFLVCILSVFHYFRLKITAHEKIDLTIVFVRFHNKSASTTYFEGIIEYSITYSGENSVFMSAFMFNGCAFHFGKTGVKMEVLGGMSFMFGPFVTNYLDGKTYMLMADEYVAYELEDEQEEAVVTTSDDKKINGTQNEKTPLIEDMHKTEKILGYKTEKYKVTTYPDETPVVLYYWMTSEIIVKTVDQQMGVTISVEGLTGFPL